MAEHVFGSPAQSTQAATELAYGVNAASHCKKTLVYMLGIGVEQDAPRVIPHFHPHRCGKHEDEVAAHVQWRVRRARARCLRPSFFTSLSSPTDDDVPLWGRPATVDR